MLINSNKNKNWTPPLCREYGKCVFNSFSNVEGHLEKSERRLSELSNAVVTGT